MDEPFGALDAQTRYAMEKELRLIWEKEKRTVCFVTNNIEEAIYLGPRGHHVRPAWQNQDRAQHYHSRAQGLYASRFFDTAQANFRRHRPCLLELHMTADNKSAYKAKREVKVCR